MMTEPITVTALNQYVKGLMDRDRLLSQVLVRSEISNYKVYPSGHHYFSLKDAESSVRCVMFRREASSLRFRPESGMKVVVSDDRSQNIPANISRSNPVFCQGIHFIFDPGERKNTVLDFNVEALFFLCLQ